MANIFGEGMCCDECAIVIANDDWTMLSNYSAAEEEERTEAIRKGLDNLGGYAYIGDEVDEFSSIRCGVCGTRLAGTRHSFTVLN